MRKVSSDEEKAKALKRMVDKIHERVKETDMRKFPSQVLKDYYDILRQLMEGIASVEGVKSEGRGAHKKLIDWSSGECSLDDVDRLFLQQLRKYRNRIEYEGFSINFSYLERNLPRIEDLINYFNDELNERL